jgi:N-acetylneuraminic acid mutarotase
MKKIILLNAILFAAGLNSSRAQDTWTQKVDFGGTARYGAVGFSIGSKGYIGTGRDASDYYHNDFWEYDPNANTWTQKADFGGTARYIAVGFSIGSKGYIGTGFSYDGNIHYYNDFWEYDPSANTWTQKAHFGGTARAYTIGFSIGSKGYIGTGNDGVNFKNDFWEYDPGTDAWIQKAPFGGTARINAVGFSIGSKGYIGTGFSEDSTLHLYNDFWEYDPVTNAWTQKTNFGGTIRTTATGFSIGSKGYIGTGAADYFVSNDFWEYDPATDTWNQKADFGGSARQSATGFSIGSKGYIGNGVDLSGTTNDFWEYTPATSSCAVPTNLSATNITSSSAKLKWDAVAGVEEYKVHYKVAGTNDWIRKSSFHNFKNISGLSPNTVYEWQVRTFCQIDSTHALSGWSPKQIFTTASLRIGDESLQQISFQIYPNPAEDHATIQLTLPQSSHVYIKVYDVSGKEIEVLLDAELQQGEHSLQIKTHHFSKGVYMVRMISDFGIENQKLIVQ